MSANANPNTSSQRPSGSTLHALEIDPFIGRGDDLAVLRALLADPQIRLVSILGPGGAGKTRLALELAASIQGEFQDGVLFVPLAQIDAAAEILPSLATALDVSLPLGGDLLQAVIDQLSARQVLLILDNFDHLLDQALVVQEILAAGPQVKALVTSREKLNLRAETLYHLSGLPFPLSTGADQGETYDAIRLFVQRARQARPGLKLDRQELSSAAHICKLVDGMPLGIILAAAWMEHFSPQAIADQIARNMDFLSQQLRDIPERHRSMRAVLDASYNRLQATQQGLFRKLAVFRGGFDLAAAEAVAGADLKTMISLVEKSLLYRDPESGRFDLHELVRQYANEKLAQAGEEDQTLAAHASCYLGLLQQLEGQLISSFQTAALDRVQADFENVGLAWTWAIEHQSLEAIERAAPPLYAFCDMRSRYGEGEALFGAALQGCMPGPGENPHPVWALALLSWYDLQPASEKKKTLAETASQAEYCLSQGVERLGPQGIAASQVLLGAIAEEQGEFSLAIQRYEQSMQLFPTLDDFYWVTMRMGLCYQAKGDYAPAIQYFQESYRRGNELGGKVKIGWALLNTGETLVLQGKRSEAEACLLRSRSLFEEVGTVVGVLWTHYSLGRLALANGQLDRSRELAHSALQIADQIHSAAWQAKTNDLLNQASASATHKPQGSSTIYEPLSERELEVLELLKSDLDGPEIAQRLFVSLNTVRYHTKNIYRKLQVSNRREAVRRAQELDI